MLLLLASCVDAAEVGSFAAASATADAGPDAGPGPPALRDAGEGRDAGSPDSSFAGVARAESAIAAGALSTCALLGEQVFCWGDNESGTLGRGTFTPSSTPVPAAVAGLGPARAVFGGPFAQCALLVDGTLRCWGDTLFGSIEGQSQHVKTPTPHDHFGLGSDVARMSHGLYFACALTTSGRGKCWGLGGAGQLGSGGDGDEYVARDLSGIDEPLVDVAASMGGFFACAVSASGHVLCWGQNTHRQLGQAGGSQSAPVVVPMLEGRFSAIACGREHACGLRDDGSVLCWGSNRRGQLGSGAATASDDAPTAIALPVGVRAIHAGADHTCAITSTGEVLCWGENADAQIADGAAVIAPTSVSPAGGDATSVTAGFGHTCILHTNRSISCRGDSSRGQTGAGDFSL